MEYCTKPKPLKFGKNSVVCPHCGKEVGLTIVMDGGGGGGGGVGGVGGGGGGGSSIGEIEVVTGRGTQRRIF
jgi:hypothetical protein